MDVIKEFNKIVDKLKAEVDSQDLSFLEYYHLNKERYKQENNFGDFETLILFRNAFQIDGDLLETPFDVMLSELIKKQSKEHEPRPVRNFECIGYMNATPGKNDFSTFVNENPSLLGGGFQYSFYDFNPSLNINLGILEYAHIYIHLNSMESIKSEAIVEERKSKTMIKDLLIKNCQNQLTVYNKCLGCNELPDTNGDCDCIRRTKHE